MELRQDFKDVLACFAAQHVEFLVVGAFAMAIHGRPRLTGDMDLLVRPDLENGKRVIAALRDFGVLPEGLTEHDFAREDSIIQLGVVPGRIDIITSITGVTWDEAWNTRVRGKLAGCDVECLSRDTLLKNKRASGRVKDLGDIKLLEDLK